MGKQMVNFISCSCESSATFFCNLQSRARTQAVLVIGLYELLGNPTTYIIEPPGPLFERGKSIYNICHIASQYKMYLCEFQKQ